MNIAETKVIIPIIYIIDDDDLVRKALQRLIRSTGFEAKTFATAEEFLDSGFREQNVCLITDVKMPGLTGLELQQKLIARGYKIPVIFITGFDEEEIRKKVKRAGAFGYFSKPLDDQALLDSIKWALSK